MHSWGYAEDNGPEVWHELFPIANGDRQSPINIITQEAKYDPSLLPLVVSYDPDSAKVIMNSGHTFSVEFEDTKDKSVISGGPFKEKYRLRQFHFHWGCFDDNGSEHKVDGQSYAAELHIVHWNSDKYSSFVEAAYKSDGLGVLGVFLKIGEHNPNIERIINALDAIKYKEKTSSFTNFDVSCLIPDCMDFWTYLGSLTVPPLFETVIWIILKEPISVTSKQGNVFMSDVIFLDNLRKKLAKFRSLLSTSEAEGAESCCMEKNRRNIQPLKGRTVQASFI